jgi:hypothetical protein
MVSMIMFREENMISAKYLLFIVFLSFLAIISGCKGSVTKNDSPDNDLTSSDAEDDLDSSPDNNRITIVASADTEIIFNDTSYYSDSFINIPDTDKYKLWIEVEEGSHTLKANRPVGLYVYGFSNYVSYAYTAGLNLQKIND